MATGVSGPPTVGVLGITRLSVTLGTISGRFCGGTLQLTCSGKNAGGVTLTKGNGVGEFDTVAERAEIGVSHEVVATATGVIVTVLGLFG